MTIPSISASPAITDLARASTESVLRGNSPTAGTATASETAPTAPQAQRVPASGEQIAQALSDVQSALQPVARNLHFSLDDDTGRTVIKIVDTSTDEVIKQIPSEEILAISKALDKLQGLLIKQEA